ncbi:MAG: DEAD/DEAH box helicase family protein [Phascolarctobacterium sp.]|uniref:DEAD/DEAH box helicase family protein n=1 Tax=Phascolarctobacterium sp. TaxID=2049039 RepID=UPI0026DB73EE|nr:DEAD/DEAH box helicase family protein [Phascolarctobacterium sp.]MDO4921199.1 DEAD/DEAH box helicase family protein [Phascolarctobacterium sp.]
MAFLYEKIDALREYGNSAALPSYIPDNLNPNFELRPYQKRAFENFITYFESNNRPKPTQVLFHMATGSGKTLIMAGLILYLYKQGYRNFLFFVNLSNIVEKTRENFCNPVSTKYLFADEIVLDGERIRINQVDNFQYADQNAINICFATTQGLHTDMFMVKENGMSFDDFAERKVVLISDEAHHLNVDTKRKRTDSEESIYRSWENTVKRIFEQNTDNLLLEFTATCDFANQAIRAAYENKIIFDYALAKFYNDKYSKDIITLRSELSIMERALQALVLSQYRLKVFQDHRLAIKPVVLFKAAKIADSKDFMTAFIETVKQLTGAQLRNLSTVATDGVMYKAFAYFAKNSISLDTLAAELRDDFSEGHCVSVNDDKDAEQKQILLNSLEDEDNPYRAIFEVKKLDEGWDVLNLFDIVRLYETRQSGGKKIAPATIAEAQLIGRGARYCPFQIDDEQPKFQRKYDEDVTSEMRVCETLYYHCQNDHRYVTELRNALREIGLDTDKIVQREYVLKEDFKATDIYLKGLIFLNDREVKDRKDVRGLSPAVRDDIYRFHAATGAAGFDSVMVENSQGVDLAVNLKTAHMRIKEIAAINYAIVNKALAKYPIFKFNTLRSYFPNLESTRQFITDDEYLGAVRIDIQSKDEHPTMETLYAAVFYVLGKIAASVSGIEETYRGTKAFRARNIRDVFRNKTVNYTEPHDGGIGISQNDPSVKRDWKIDLSVEDWFVYTDNYGTSEEKAFVAYFRGYVADLRKIYNRIYLVRNEREFHIYSFENGERFEPDYVLFLQRDKEDGFEQLQIFIEPKGTQLIEKDAWKEKFLLQLKTGAVPTKIFVDDNDYKIWGLHFFNQDSRMKEFDSELASLIGKYL